MCISFFAFALQWQMLISYLLCGLVFSLSIHLLLLLRIMGYLLSIFHYQQILWSPNVQVLFFGFIELLVLSLTTYLLHFLAILITAYTWCLVCQKHSNFIDVQYFNILSKGFEAFDILQHLLIWSVATAWSHNMCYYPVWTPISLIQQMFCSLESILWW